MDGRKLALHRETVRNLSDGDLGKVAGGQTFTYTRAVRAYSVNEEYTCNCDTNPQHGCEGITTGCGNTQLTCQ